jgi:hypothetical protein
MRVRTMLPVLILLCFVIAFLLGQSSGSAQKNEEKEQGLIQRVKDLEERNAKLQVSNIERVIVLVRASEKAKDDEPDGPGGKSRQVFTCKKFGPKEMDEFEILWSSKGKKAIAAWQAPLFGHVDPKTFGGYFNTQVDKKDGKVYLSVRSTEGSNVSVVLSVYILYREE